MKLITGGAYQGKLEYAKKQYQIRDEEICDLSINVEKKRCYCHLEAFVLQCIKEEKDATEELEALIDDESIVICDDISCGIVPMDKTTRAWRETTGRIVNGLAGKAEAVTRIFCGLPMVLK